MLNKVYLSYRKNVTYEKTGHFLTKFEPEVIKSWLEEEVETDIHNSTLGYTEEDIEDLEMNIDSVIDERRLEWEEVSTSFEQCGFHHEPTTNYSGEGPCDRSIQMWIDKNKIESLTQQVESLNQKIKQGETK